MASVGSKPASRLSLLHSISVATLLLGEGILLGIRFEGPDLGSEWWTVVLSQASNVIRFGIAGGAAIVLLGAGQIRAQFRLASAPAVRRRLWPLLVGHAIAFIGFFRLTAFVIEGALRVSPHPGLWVAAWVATGMVSVALGIAVALPAKAVLPLARALSRVALVGIVVGAGAFAAGQLTSRAWRPLGRLTLSSVNAVISWIAIDPIVDPAHMIVGTQRFFVEIAAECSGYEGIGLMWVFLGAYVWSYRAALQLPRALLLLPLGTCVAWALNIARIVALIAVGTWLSPEIALGGFHSYSGWLLFCGGALALVAMTRRSSFFALPDAVGDSVATQNPTAVYLCPFLALVLAGMGTSAFTLAGFDALYPVKVAAVAATLWWFRRDYRKLRRTVSWSAVGAGAVVFVLWMALEHVRADTGQDSALRAGLMTLPAGWAGAWLSLRVIGSVLTVPVAEELAFRGYLLRRLIAADFESVSFRQLSWVAVLGSSLVFGAMHDRLLAGTLAGIVYALTVQRRGELCDAVVAHATTNLLLAVYVLTMGAWSLWV